MIYNNGKLNKTAYAKDDILSEQSVQLEALEVEIAQAT